MCVYNKNVHETTLFTRGKRQVLVVCVISRDGNVCGLKLAFHGAADTDTDADSNSPDTPKILTSDTRDFLKLVWQAERHATIIARMSVSVSASWNAGLTVQSVPQLSDRSSTTTDAQRKNWFITVHAVTRRHF